MKSKLKILPTCITKYSITCILVLVILTNEGKTQTATVSNPLAIGQNCSGGSNNFKSFSYDSVTKKLTQIGLNCNPSLQSPGFNPGGGSIAFSPKDQKVYYIETTTGNNSIVWSWTPGVCPILSQAPIYTYSSTFIVGLEFNTLTGDGYQLEFSTGAAPYTIYLRKVTSFGPPLVAGAPQQIILPSGKQIYQQNGDILITPTGKMYFVLDNKMFSLDYSPYGTGTLNANYIDTLKNGAGNNVIGLSYANGNFIVSVQGSSCSYAQVDISSGAASVKPVTLASGNFVAYDMATMVTGIGAAKAVQSLSLTGVNQYRVVYDIKVKNYGNVNLNSVQVTDDIKTVFGSSFVNASITAVGTLPTGLTLNPLFNGNTITGIFTAGSTMKASPSDSAIIRVTVDLNNPNTLTTYLNSAVATATGAIFANNVRDSSDNQASLNPDISGTDVPDTKGEAVPTPITPIMWLLLDNDITSFTAKANNTGLINIEWTLANQAAGTITTLQRSLDGLSFVPIANFNSNGLIKENYSYRDQSASPVTYYRLQIKSTGNAYIYSPVLRVTNQETNEKLTILPNPFQQTLHFMFTMDKTEIIKYRLMNFSSVEIQSGEFIGHPGSNLFVIDGLDKLPMGNYILLVASGNKVFSKKVYKN